MLQRHFIEATAKNQLTDACLTVTDSSQKRVKGKKFR